VGDGFFPWVATALDLVLEFLAEGFDAGFGLLQFEPWWRPVRRGRTMTPLRDRAAFVEVRLPPEADPRTPRRWGS
jgi:hypothetical protein